MIELQSRPAEEERRRLSQVACEEAARRGEPVLLAFTQDVEALDTLRLYARAARGGSDAVYWEQPSRRDAIVAAGAAQAAELHGEGRFAAAAATWEALFAGAVTNRRDDLVALAGFAFSAQTRHAGHWAAFGDGLLVVPALTYRRSASRAHVTLATMVQPGATPDEVAFPIASLLRDDGGDPSRPATAPAALDGDAGAGEWKRGVHAIAGAIDRGAVAKVVLAREVVTRFRSGVDDVAALARLRESYPDCTIFSFRRGGECFLGATPECLVRVEGATVHATCLAGSARRGDDAQDDAARGDALLSDDKELREHRMVVDMIAASLAPFCTVLDVPEAPVLMKMPNVQHLYTPMRGALASGANVLELVERLHPTPAVGGMPRAAALDLIHENETFDRGWYAGPVGWIGARGDGEFSVALRSGLVRGREARLYAGCGIVAGSDPQREYEESKLKLRPMLCALQA
jgi:isochorismate synthase